MNNIETNETTGPIDTRLLQVLMPDIETNRQEEPLTDSPLTKEEIKFIESCHKAINFLLDQNNQTNNSLIEQLLKLYQVLDNYIRSLDKFKNKAMSLASDNQQIKNRINVMWREYYKQCNDLLAQLNSTTNQSFPIIDSISKLLEFYEILGRSKEALLAAIIIEIDVTVEDFPPTELFSRRTPIGRATAEILARVQKAAKAQLSPLDPDA